MLNRAALTLFVTITLAGFTAAYPHLHPHRRSIAPYTTIPLGRRNTLTRDDGTFDAEKAVHSALMTKSKHEQNLLNFRRNVPDKVLPGVVRYTLSDPYPRRNVYHPQNTVNSLSHVSRSEAHGIGSEQLTVQNQNSEFIGQVFIGTPRHPFAIDFDTGSSDLWVPENTCNSSVCMTRNRYDPSSSTSSKPEPGQFTINYADKSTVQGGIYTDTVSVAGIQVEEQYLAAASVLSPQFKSSAEDGLV